MLHYVDFLWSCTLNPQQIRNKLYNRKHVVRLVVQQSPQQIEITEPTPDYVNVLDYTISLIVRIRVVFVYGGVVYL